MSRSDLTDEALAAINARAEAATPGPWRAPKRERLEPVVFFASGDAADVIQGVAGNSPGKHIGLSPEDAEFIAHSREDVPALVAEVRRLRRLLKTTTKERDRAVALHQRRARLP